MARTVSEWIGKTDDHRAPGTVRQRVFDRERGCCHLCGQPIQTPGQKWDLDHVKALINGGENRDTNLKPAHRKCHKDKTRADIAEKVKVAAMRQRHTGAKGPAGNLKSAPFTPSEKTARRNERAAGQAPLSPRPLFAQIDARR